MKTVYDTIIGIDIGGTKCSVVIADGNGKIQSKKMFKTRDCKSTIQEFIRITQTVLSSKKAAFGISCGGPLDSKLGIIQTPPNLPDWNDIPIVQIFEETFGGKAFLMNDANAGALAEWKYGAARGYQNVIFLTYGTGMGGGLILNGQLHEGASGMAGEIGHVRLASMGPVGYNKAGSFEGFCSGTGIAELGKIKARELNGRVSFVHSSIDDITAKDVAEAARQGDPAAKEVFELSGCYLGKALSILIDIINPEVIVLGSVYLKCRDLLEPPMQKILRKECLPQSLDCCEILPTGLGEEIGDYAALSIARYYIDNTE